MLKLVGEGVIFGVRSSALWASLRLGCGLAPWTGPGLGAWKWRLGRPGKEEASPARVGRCLAGISRARFQLPLQESVEP